MSKKYLLIIGLLFLFLCVNHSFAADDILDEGNKTNLTVYAFHSYPIESLVSEIMSLEYYKGYDNDTVAWMTQHYGDIAFSSKGNFVIMDKRDALKLPTMDATDVEITDDFSCKIVENRSLGKGLNNVLYVRDVEFIKQNEHSLDLA